MVNPSGEEIDVKGLRLQHGWSQRQLAEHLGCDAATVCRIEAGGAISGPIGKLLRILSNDPSALTGSALTGSEAA